MEHIFVSFFQTHLDIFRHFGYLIIFIITYVESVPLLGMLVPGQTIIILAGFMVKLHFFGFWLSVLVGTIGAMFGDLTGFYLGHKYGHHFTSAERKFYIKREQFEKTRALISSHPFTSVFFGRLHSLTRTLTPFAAGASNIGLKKFIAIDILASFVWAFLSILIGFIFGKSFEKASSFLGSFILIATLISVCIMIAVHYAKKKNIKISQINIVVFITSVTSLYLFGLIANDLETGRLFNILDQRLYSLRYLIISEPLTIVMKIFTTLGGSIYIPFLTVLYVFYLARKNEYKNILLVLTTLISGIIMVLILKSYYDRIRPLGIIMESGGSFPSGHMMMSIIFAILISYLSLRNIKSIFKKNLALTLVYLTSLIIGFSRVYLGVHYTSDVIAGLLFGVFWATFCIVAFNGISFIIDIGKKKHRIPLP